MKKLAIIPIICTVLLLMLALTPASATTFDIYPDSTTTVKEIMDNKAQPGDTIFFHAGTYSYPGVLETYILNIENITWKGEGPDLVTLSMSELLRLDAEGTTVEGFTIKTNPITVISSNCHISNCVMKNVPDGLLMGVESATNCIVDNCVFEGITNDEGIKIQESNTIFANNTIKGATGEFSAITIDAEKCTITNNTITDSEGAGITLYKAVDTLITYNNIYSNGYAGIELYEVTGVNTIYGNNIVNNGVTATTTGTSAPTLTHWNSTEALEYSYNGVTRTGYLGNYYSDYTGTDEDGDGIGDTPYVVPDKLGTDYVPLVAPFENYLVEADEDSDSSSQEITDADWASFQKDNYNRGVTAERGPITYPDSNQSWDVYAGFINTAPIVVGDKVIVSGNGLKAYNRTGGDELWTGSGGGLGNPACGNGTVFVPANAYIYAVDLLSGETIWKRHAGSNDDAQLNTPVTYDDHRIYFGEWCGLQKYYCYYDNGTECWNRTSTSGGGYYWAGAAIIGDYLVYGDDGDHICSVNKYTGETIEDMDVSSVFGVSAKQIRSAIVYVEEYEKIYFSTQGCYCFSIGFNKTDGTFDTSDKHYVYTGCSTSTPAIYNDRLYMGIGGAGSKTAPLYCFNATDLTEIWNFTAGGGIQSSPVVSTYYDDGDGEVYIYFTTNTEKGTIYCLRDYEGNTGAKEVWHYTPPKGKYQYTLGGAAISDGFVYFGNNINMWGDHDGGYFFGLTDSDPETSPRTPVAEFSANVSSGEAPLTVQFTDSSTNSPTSWAWDFNNDGVIDSTRQNPNWTYSEKGSYSVNLKVENPAGNDTLTKEAFIKVAGPTVLSFNPLGTSAGKNMTAEIQVTADLFPEGLSGYNLTVSIGDPSIAEITGIEFPAWANPTENSSLSGTSIYLKVTDAPLNSEDETGTVKPGDGNVGLANISMLGKKTGTTNISITVSKMDDDEGNEIKATVLSGSLSVGTEAFPDSLCVGSPKDLNGDGIYEDITGNGECTFTDLELYFHYMKWIEENRPVEAFDFNGNGRIDFNDVVLMFKEVRPVE